jgi:hypothetical protein
VILAVPGGQAALTGGLYILFFGFYITFHITFPVSISLSILLFPVYISFFPVSISLSISLSRGEDLDLALIIVERKKGKWGRQLGTGKWGRGHCGAAFAQEAKDQDFCHPR